MSHLSLSQRPCRSKGSCPHDTPCTTAYLVFQPWHRLRISSSEGAVPPSEPPPLLPLPLPRRSKPEPSYAPPASRARARARARQWANQGETGECKESEERRERERERERTQLTFVDTVACPAETESAKSVNASSHYP